MTQVYSSRRKKKTKVLGFFVLAAFLSLLASGIALGYIVFRNLPDPTMIKERAVSESTKIYDRSGKIILFEIHGEEKRTVVPLTDIPEIVKKSTLAAEDARFYEHKGLDWRGILRAAFKLVKERRITQGGSTITQQVVKNSLLGWSQRNILRKIREQVTAILLERRYSKDEILEIYLNQIPYGSNAYGIVAASRTYFGKEIQDLSLAEAAALAALPKAPTYYSPYGSHKAEFLARKDWVLNRMAETGFISPEEARRAQEQELVFSPPRQIIRAPHFVMYVREYLNQKYGEWFVEQGGLKVITTLDWRIQEEAEKIVKEGAERNEELVQAANAALVALDPRNGEILAMVGSKDYWGKPFPEGCTPGINCRFDPHVNIAIRPRQPGSAFKPFVYATAFKKGYTPETVVMDVPTEFNPMCTFDGRLDVLNHQNINKANTKCYHPQNYDGKFRGPVTLRQALAQSLNVPSVKILYLAGVKDSILTAKEMGITTLADPDRYGLSLVLGGAEVTLLEMVSSFGAFSQDGILHPKTAILRIEDSRGVVLEEKKDISLPVLDTEVSRTINDILSDNNARIPVFSPQSSLYFPDRQVAAKTGTTQDFRDAWVIGYTPSLVAGVWVGNNDNTPMNQKGLSVMVAGPIWHKFLEFALKDTPPQEFPRPQPKQPEKSILRGLYRLGPVVRIDKISGKLATPLTPPDLVEEASFGTIVSILAHVKKDDPLGPPPENPEDDPQYKHWQRAIEEWLKQNPLSATEPPTEFDDLHTEEKRPKITLDLPANISPPLQEIAIKVQTVFPLQEVSLFINDVFIDAKTAPLVGENIIFSLAESIEEDGVYTIKITAYDAVGNRSTAERAVNISK